MTKEIVISDGTIVIVDAEDYDWLTEWKWSATGNGYAMRGIYIGEGRYEFVTMHREIIGAEEGETVDHINRDKSDNRRSNLRIASRSQNATNSKHRKNKSGYRGVYFDKRRNNWKSEIRVGPGKRMHLGTFDCPIEAAKSYNEAATKYHGEFATINQIEKDEVE